MLLKVCLYFKTIGTWLHKKLKARHSNLFMVRPLTEKTSPWVEDGTKEKTPKFLDRYLLIFDGRAGGSLCCQVFLLGQLDGPLEVGVLRRFLLDPLVRRSRRSTALPEGVGDLALFQTLMLLHLRGR